MQWAVDLRQEHLGLLQMEGSQRSAVDESRLNSPAMITAAERYQALKARQIDALEILQVESRDLPNKPGILPSERAD